MILRLVTNSACVRCKSTSQGSSGEVCCFGPRWLDSGAKFINETVRTKELRRIKLISRHRHANLMQIREFGQLDYEALCCLTPDEIERNVHALDVDSQRTSGSFQIAGSLVLVVGCCGRLSLEKYAFPSEVTRPPAVAPGFATGHGKRRPGGFPTPETRFRERSGVVQHAYQAGKSC